MTFFHLFSCPTIQIRISQSGYKNSVGDHVKNLAKVQVENSHWCSHIHRSHRFIIKSNGAGQVQTIFNKYILTIPNRGIFLNVPGNGIQENSLKIFPGAKAKLSGL